jgi:hypothetical protein
VVRPNFRHVFLFVLDDLLDGHVAQRGWLLVVGLHPFAQVVGLVGVLSLGILLLFVLRVFSLNVVFRFMLVLVLLIFQFFIDVFVSFHVVLFELLVFFLFAGLSHVNFSPVLVHLGEILEGGVGEHFVESAVNFYFCYLLFWTQKFWIVWRFRKSLVQFNLFALWLLVVSGGLGVYDVGFGIVLLVGIGFGWRLVYGLLWFLYGFAFLGRIVGIWIGLLFLLRMGFGLIELFMLFSHLWEVDFWNDNNGYIKVEVFIIMCSLYVVVCEFIFLLK